MHEKVQLTTQSSSSVVVAREVSDQIDAMNASLDDVFGGVTTDEKPPLPEKTRKSSVRRVSTYDNVDEIDAAELRFVGGAHILLTHSHTCLLNLFLEIISQI